MGTLASELGRHVGQFVDRPRVYVDANVPAGAVSYMRERLEWDVLFVVEDDMLRRAPDEEHYELARTLGRTLLSLDHDYFDETRFPPQLSGGVIVLSAPDARTLQKLLRRIDRVLFGRRGTRRTPPGDCPSLSGRTLRVDADWASPPPRRRSRRRPRP